MDKAFFKQAWIVSGVLLAMLEVGMFLGFTTCLLPALKDPSSPIKASLEQSSWIAASFSLAWIPGFVSSSYYMDRYGRKPAFILDIIPGALGVVLMYFSTNVSCLIAARVLEGITAGSTSILGAVVIGEYTSPANRGMFLNLKTAALYLGSMVVHLMGYYFHWRTVAILTLIPYLIAIGMVCTWPESPSWLASAKKFDDTARVFYSLRGRNELSTRELKELITTQKEQPKTVGLTFLYSSLKFIRKFGRKDFLMPVLNYFFAAILLETTGRHIFPAYAVQIISEISGNHDSFYYTLALDILVTVSSTFSSILIRLVKRRTMLFLTGSVAFLVLMSACCDLFLTARQIIPNTPWIPMSLFAIYLVIVNLACAPIPLSLIGEIFPLEHRAAGSNIAGLLIALTSIATLKMTPLLMATIKVYGTFCILGVIMAISLVFLYFMLPETKDKTLQEIEYFYNHGKFRDVLQDDEAESNMIELPRIENAKEGSS